MAEKVPVTIPRSKIRQKEIFDLFAMYAFDAELKKAARDMDERLSVIPGGKEDLKTIQETLARLTQNILYTIPQDKLRTIQTSMHRMAYKVYMDATLPAYSPDDLVINQEDFDALAEAAHEFKCAFCVEDCNTCPLGKALDHSLARSRDKDESWANIDWNERNND